MSAQNAERNRRFDAKCFEMLLQRLFLHFFVPMSARNKCPTNTTTYKTLKKEATAAATTTTTTPTTTTLSTTTTTTTATKATTTTITMTTTTTTTTTATLATYDNINILNTGHCPAESSSETQDQAAVPMLLVTQGTVSSRSGKWCYESEELFRSSESKGSKRQVRNGWFGNFVPWLQAGTSLLPTDGVRLKNEIRHFSVLLVS